MQTKHDSSHTSENQADRGSRKLYQPPRILSRERLESAADVCNGEGLKEHATITVPGNTLPCGAINLQS